MAPSPRTSSARHQYSGPFCLPIRPAHLESESIVEGFHENDIRVSLRDVPVSLVSDEPIGHRFRGFEVHDISLIHVQPEPLFSRAYEVAGLARRSKKPYTIGYWYWEFDEIPNSWNRAAADCDEIWTATSFVCRRSA